MYIAATLDICTRPCEEVVADARQKAEAMTGGRLL
jgi:hypothetical protein